MEATWTSPSGLVETVAVDNGFDPPEPIELGDWTLEVEMTNCTVCTATIALIEETSPGANFTVVQDGICGDQGIIFDVNNVDSDLDYLWNFGDGSTSTDPQPTHPYFLDGGESQTVTVSLTVTNEQGCSATTSQNITVLQIPNPNLGELDPLCQPEVENEPYQLLPPDFTPSFNPINGITSITIDWGNGSDTVITEILPSNEGGYIGTTYSSFGYYNVVVTSLAANGCISIYSDSLFIGNNPQIGSANPGNTVGLCSPTELGFPIFNFADNAPETMYLLDFGDGTSEWITHEFLTSPAFPDSVFHTYNASSCGEEYSTQTTTYSNALVFTIEAVNDCFSSSNSVGPITVHSSPNPQLGGPANVCVGYAGQYSANDFGQVVTSNGCNPSNVEWYVQPLNGQQNTSPYFGFDSIWSLSFPEPGEYSVEFTANHSACGTATTEMTVCVYPELQAVGQVAPLSGCAPLLVDLEDLTGDPVLCGDPTTTWTISGPGGYNWVSGGLNATAATVEFPSPGVYNVELKVGIPSKDACPESVLQWSIEVLAPPPANINVAPIACEGEDVIGLYFTNTTPQTPVDSWSWTLDGNVEGSNAGDINFGPLTAGSHTLIGTATNLCGSASDQVTFDVQSAPDISFSLPAPTACAGTNVDVTASGTGGATFQWTSNPDFVGAPTGPSVTVNAMTTTTIEVTATGTNGCVSSDDVEVVYTPLPVAAATLPTPPCPGQTVTISGTASGGTTPYASFDWSGDLSATGQPGVNWTAPPTATALNLTLTVTDALGCLDDIPVSFSSLDNPTVEAGGPLTLCDNGTYTTTLSGFSPGLTDGGTGVWSGTGVTGAGGFTTSGTGTSVLTYTFTDINGCVAEDQLTVNVEPFVQVDEGLPAEACQNDAPFVIQGFAPATASWSGTGVATDGTVDPGLPPNTYTLTLVNGVGSCESTATSTFTIHPLPTPAISAPTAVCQDDVFDATLSEPSAPDVFWADDATLPLTRTETAGNQNITLTGTAVTPEGCTADISTTVVVNLLPVITIPDQGVLCNLPILTTLTGATPADGEWTGTGVVDGDAGTFDPSQVSTGTVDLTYTFEDGNNCVNSADVTVTIDDPVTAEAGDDLSICDEDITLALGGFTPASGGAWSSADVTVDAAGNVDAGPLAPGNYELTYTYGTGTCQNSDSRTLTVHELPVIALTASAPALCEGATFTFTGDVSGGLPPYTYSWSGVTPGVDGATTTTATAFAGSAGTLTATLTVTDDRGCEETAQVTVTVWPLPVVDAGPDISLCDQAIATTLTGFTPPGGSWSGNGITNAMLGEFLPSIPGPGTVNPVYTFTDGNGCTNDDDITIDIQVPQIADAGPDVTVCDNDYPVQLNGSPATGSAWSGGSPGADPGLTNPATGLVSPGILTPGSYTYVIEYGSGTCYTADQVDVTVLALPPVGIPGPDAFCGNLGTVLLTQATPTGGTWYGTGILDPTAGTFTSALAPGTYTPSYWFEDALTGCRDTVEHTVTVHPVPTADFTHDPLGCSNLDLPLNNLSTGTTLQSWDFGGLMSSSDFEPGFTFPGDGTYTIDLTVENGFGCVDYASSSVDITHPPTADLLLTPDFGCAPLDVQFANLSDAPFGNYLWDINGTQYTQQAPPALNFTQGDSIVDYAVSLTATNLCGSDVVEDAIVVYPTPVMGFAFEEDTVCSPFEMNIMSTSVGLPDDVVWDFGDGTGFTGADPPDHWYSVGDVEEVFTVTVTGTNQCGTDAVSGDVLVLPNQVEAFFTLSTPDGCAPFTLGVEDFSSATTAVSYDFDNGDFAATPIASTTYPLPGTYTVTQFVTNGCSYDTLQIPVVVHPIPNVTLAVADPSLCAGAPFAFASTTDNPGNADWDFGDGAAGAGLSTTHAYANAGNYTVTFSTEAPLTGCTAEASLDVLVHPNPVPSFDLSDGLGCAPLTVNFDNTSSGGAFQTWHFGDGSQPAFTLAPTHTFENPGLTPLQFTVTLVTESAQLCVDSTSAVITALPTPQAAFSLESAESCSFPVDIVIENASVGSINHSWSVNGGTPVVAPAPTFAADAVGTYTVTLIAANGYACSDEAEEDFTVHLAPIANLNANPRIGCNPLSVDFQDLSSYSQATSLFIDGIYDGPLPTEGLIIDQVGTFESYIVAVSPEGCADTLSLADDFTVHPVPVADFSFYPLAISPENTSFQFLTDSNLTVTSWTFGDGNGSYAATPIHRYDEPGEYQVVLTIQNEFGCSDVAVDLVTIDDQISLFVPNAFTPASEGIGDGINDAWKPIIRGTNLIQKYTLLVFDQWGEVVFQTNDYDEYWTGAVRGLDGNPGDHYSANEVYNWQIRLFLSGSEDDERIFHGHVTLVR